MIKAEVDGSGLLLLAAGCSAVKVGGPLSVDGVAGLPDAGESTVPSPWFDFFFFVMLSTKGEPFTNVCCGFLDIIFVEEARFVQGPSQRED